MDSETRSILTNRKLEGNVIVYTKQGTRFVEVVVIPRVNNKKLIEAIKLLTDKHILVSMKIINDIPEVSLFSVEAQKIYDIEQGGIRLKKYMPIEGNKALYQQALRSFILSYTN